MDNAAGRLLFTEYFLMVYRVLLEYTIITEYSGDFLLSLLLVCILFLYVDRKKLATERRRIYNVDDALALGLRRIYC